MEFSWYYHLELGQRLHSSQPSGLYKFPFDYSLLIYNIYYLLTFVSIAL